MKLWVKLSAAVGGILLGTVLGAGLETVLGDEVVALAAVRVVGCFVLGMVSGLLGPHRPAPRLLLACGGLTAFTSWPCLAVRGLTQGGDVVIAVAETAFAVMFALLGHLAGFKLRRVED